MAASGAALCPGVNPAGASAASYPLPATSASTSWPKCRGLLPRRVATWLPLRATLVDESLDAVAGDEHSATDVHGLQLTRSDEAVELCLANAAQAHLRLGGRVQCGGLCLCR